MIKLLITLTFVAVAMCGPLNQALKEADIPEGSKADNGVAEEQPQADGLSASTYDAIKQKYAMLMQMQREVNRMSRPSYGSKGQSRTNAQYEVRTNYGSKGQSRTNTQLEALTNYGSKGQTTANQLEVMEPMQACASEKNEIEVLQTSNTVLKNQVEQYLGATQEAQQQNRQLSAMNAHLYAQKGEYKATIANLDADNARMREENTMLRAEKANLEKQVEQNLAEITNLNNQVAQLNQDIANLNNALEECNARNAELESLVQEKDQEIANLNTQVEQLNEEIRGLKARIDELEAQVAELQSTNQELTAELAQTREQLENCNREVDNLRSNIESLNGEIANLQTNINRLNAENAQLQQEKEELIEAAATSLAKLTQCEAKPCPDGYFHAQNNKCYKYVSQKMPWKSAQEYCMSEKANLASITSQEDQTEIAQYLRTETDAKRISSHVFIGGSKDDSGNWSWMAQKDQPMSDGPQSWRGDYPKEIGNCLSMYLAAKSTSFGNWVDSNCDWYLPSICEFER